LGTLPLIEAASSETPSEVRSRLLADERDLTSAADGDLEYWQKVAGESSGPILEIGCGAGRVLTALGPGERQLTGIDLDVSALTLAAERAPAAEWIRADGRTWRRDGTAASLVILSGDLLSLITAPNDLEALLRTAAMHCAPGGQVGIDATLMDPQLFADEIEGDWGVDLERADEDFTTVRRESRIAPDPHARANSVLLEIRHRAVGADGQFTAIYPDRTPFAIRAWQPDEVRTIAAAAGLQVVRVGADDRLRWLLRSANE
jgi:SAM-dependent methyltransferase